MMKKKNVLVMVMMGLAILFCGTSCSEDENTDGPDNGSVLTEEEIDAAIATYVDDIVIPTYKDMLDKVTIFKTKVDAFVASGSQEDLNIACQAWRTAREPWEYSEAHLGGPADVLNLDPSMDSWPLDKEGINGIIKSGDFSKLEGYEDKSMELRGFHTAEYMLFFDGQPRDLTKSQDELDLSNTNLKKYLQIVVEDIFKDTETLYNAWAKGLEGNDDYPTSYGEALKKHDSTYGKTSAEVVLSVILAEEGGMAAIANEVGEIKIGDPITNYKEDPEKGLLSVESWYSWNSITDYSNNIKGVRNCYLGSLDGKTVNASSLSALVKKVDASLDTKVQEKINAAIAAIENIPAPFRNHLDVTKYPQVTAAQDACAEVVDVLKEVRTKLGAN